MGWRRGQALSQDLRDRVLAAPGAAAAVAARFGVSASYVLKVRAQRTRGVLSAGAQRNHVPRRLAGLDAQIAAHVAAQPLQTIEQVRAWLAHQHGAAVSHATTCKALARLGLTRKK